ncbi:10630_t:CDS:2, partial [Gigaspora margarita]
QQARLLSHDAFPEYKIELNKPQLCNETAQQYSGYLHVNNNIHLFFWFFESRNQHPEDPIVLWLNGGPGFCQRSHEIVDKIWYRCVKEIMQIHYANIDISIRISIYASTPPLYYNAVCNSNGRLDRLSVAHIYA